MNGWKLLSKAMEAVEVACMCLFVLLCLIVTAIPGFLISLIVSCFIFKGPEVPTAMYWTIAVMSMLSIICCTIAFFINEHGGWDKSKQILINKAKKTEEIKEKKKLNKGGEVSVASPINGALSRPELGGEV